ncbi:hypothetical protein PRIPAC_77810 [Pristionchus pacificus]|nr:hypothetical protein PRIPAC_77810 [Pristionchus pacificus]|eukprot:PDM70775.1 hypothetical protein PRIPAC_44979 [Pristionchus pacificus]
MLLPPLPLLLLRPPSVVRPLLLLLLPLHLILHLQHLTLEDRILPYLPVHCLLPGCMFVNKLKEKKEYRNLHSALNHAWEMHGGWSLTKEQLKATCTVCKLPSSDCTNTEEVLTHLKKCGCHFIIGPK